MATVKAEQAGREYTFVLSNNGLRVEFGGVEIFRHWPVSAPVNTAPVGQDTTLVYEVKQ